jgi:N-methylhydantoinase A/oxoprolinase/acetone carboxylase beta subunit
VDIGGTFTDAVLLDDETGACWTAKVLTTGSPDEGAVASTRTVLESAHAGFDQVAMLVHATTLASNTVLQRRGARVALVTNAGFEDLLALRREVRYDAWNPSAPFVEPLVPRPLCFGVAGRMLVDGTEYEPIDPVSVERLGAHLAQEGIEAVAVCLLHSYANAAHEVAVGAALARRLGHHVPISLSSTVCPEAREYERMSTTVINAYVQPAISGYQQRLEFELARLGYPGPIQVMISSGGVATTQVTSALPVRLIESGPVAGALAAAHYASQLGIGALLALDIGGTTAKACLIRKGQPERGNGIEVARVDRYVAGSGLPVRVPSIDLIEVGAGGGSIARADVLNFLQVGPQSAESRPGPACYDLGGVEPTVTDANLLLGLLDPDRFANGTIALSREAAEKAVTGLAVQLSMSTVQCAAAIVDMINENMADAARVHLAEKGQDPAQVTLLASGGGGPLHAVAICRKLGIRTAIIPPRAGVLSAVGLLVTAPAVDFTRTMVRRLTGDVEWPSVNNGLDELEQRVRAVLAATGIAAVDVSIERTVTARWVGQTHEVEIGVPAGRLSAASADALVDAYNEACRLVFGSNLRPTVLELLTWRVNGRAANSTTLKAPSGTTPEPAVTGTREIVFPDRRRQPETATVYDRHRIPPGFAAAGPAVIEEAESTCVLSGEDSFAMDGSGNLVISVGEARA